MLEMKTILLTEDSRTQADRIRGILESQGYAVEWVPSAGQALESLARGRYDLVVTDILMPGMDGFELCRAIKADPSIRHVPVVLLTALSGPADILKGLECGADGFVPKLYEEDLLLPRVRYTLDNAGKAKPGRAEEEGRTDIVFQERVHSISSTPGQVVNFLLGAYEIALRMNEESARAREDLERLNARLENLVEERTLALREEIRERQKVHEALMRSEEQLRQAAKMEAVGQLAGGIAHDFNNLMTAVNGYSGLLLERFPQGDEAWEFLNLIRQAGEKATQLTGQLLAFGRRQMLSPRVLDINQSVDSICALLDRLIGSHIRVERGQHPDLWKTKVDPVQIEQVLMNLMINARDAMPEGGTLTLSTANVTVPPYSGVTAEELAPGDYVLVSVEDTGIGMDEALKARIFEPFFSTKDRFKGSGLGLATSYGIIKQSGGHIAVQSVPGEGSRFQVYLPRAQAEASPKPSLPTPGVPSRGGNETLLVAEDDEAVRKLVVGLLELKGYRVLAAPDGLAALELAQAEPGTIRLLLTDLMMPNLSGRELARRLAPLRPGLKVIYMSGFSEEVAFPKEDLEEGADFIAKPFTSADLWRRVREMLDGPGHPKAAA
jgi:two-component system, cell cycle sensor histidine kinase and response regulator CckA